MEDSARWNKSTGDYSLHQVTRFQAFIYCRLSHSQHTLDQSKWIAGMLGTKIVAEYKVAQVNLKTTCKFLHQFMGIISVHAQVVIQTGIGFYPVQWYADKVSDASPYFICNARWVYALFVHACSVARVSLVSLFIGCISCFPTYRVGHSK